MPHFIDYLEEKYPQLHYLCENKYFRAFIL